MSHTIRVRYADGSPAIVVSHHGDVSTLTPEQALALASELVVAANVADRVNPARLPSTPGIYRDRQGDVWVLTGTGDWILPVDDTSREPIPAEQVARFLPLTPALTLDRVTD